ncbi:MAG: hypothetical protein QNJ46_11270 [Leptolyngbyaceae cyanobacterium MO_188.B28]|nr:hypothetical protein [Leptolyngbyaceae cyanobacterium MO_188.B28]
MTDEELKALVASNAQSVQANAAAIASNAAAIADLKQLTQKSYEDMVAMLTQFAEEAAADRHAIRAEMTGIRTELTRLTEHVLGGNA